MQLSPRVKAFLIHLGISASIALLMLALVFLVWYPSPLESAIGVTQIFLLLLAVDVVIGPMLTLAVFKVGEKSLKFDLSVIAIVQLAALAYGSYTVMIGRPAWIVYNVDRFDVVRAYELQEKYQKLAKPEYASAPLWGPKWIAAITPTDNDERNALTMESVQGGADLPQRPNYYIPLSNVKSGMQSHTKQLTELNKYNPGDEAKIQVILKRYPQADSFVPLRAPIENMSVLLRKDTAEVIAVVELKPW